MKRILVIDNDIELLHVLQLAFEYEGFLVNCDTNTKNALALINKYQPDLILLDLFLNGPDGGELCQHIKTQPGTKNVPVILFTASANPLLTAGSYCCDDFIQKPFDLYELIQKIVSFTSCAQPLHK